VAAQYDGPETLMALRLKRNQAGHVRLLQWGALASALWFTAIVNAPTKPYTLEDLQALDRQKAWSELFAHLRDVRPSQRGPAWNQIATHVCLQP
jgi:hypothetical protein